MTAGEAGLAVHICTRNRASSVRSLLGDLALVLDGRPATVTVYDDSTTLAYRDATRAVCRGAAVDVRYFGEPERVSLLARGRAALGSGPALACLETSRPLGTPGWDLAGVRFTGMLHAALDPHPDGLHLFLDDDMRLVSCSYAGFDLAVDPARVGDGLRAAGDRLRSAPFAAGAPFLGRVDLSILEHFEVVVHRLAGGEAVAVGGTASAPSFPVVVSAAPDIHPDSPGISGGFLLTNGHALRSVPLVRSYNEDWIWLRQLLGLGGTVHRLPFSVVHAGTPRFRLTGRGLLTQFHGEVLDQALAVGSVDAAFRECARRLHGVLEQAEDVSRNGAGPAMVEATRTLGRVAARVRMGSAAGYPATLGEHLRRSCLWRDALAAEPDREPVTVRGVVAAAV